MSQFQPVTVERILFLVGHKTMQQSIHLEGRGIDQWQKHFQQFFSVLVVRLLR